MYFSCYIEEVGECGELGFGLGLGEGGIFFQAILYLYDFLCEYFVFVILGLGLVRGLLFLVFIE